jgi:4'-phosphopantetheinyl transferase
MTLGTSLVPSWSLPPAKSLLTSNDIHVWRSALDLPPRSIERLRLTLSADEQLRADRFHFQSDRTCFIAAHGILRSILGHYLIRAPGSLTFGYGAHGKPALSGDSGGDAIRFNISHSRGIALYAIARDREVGIDVEFIRHDLEFEQIAERFFSTREIAALRILPAEIRMRAFFQCWTRKEAYIKARGEGLSLPLDQFDVSLIPGEPTALLSTRPDPAEAHRWSLRELTPGAEYAAAIAVAGRSASFTCWQWPHLDSIQPRS